MTETGCIVLNEVNVSFEWLWFYSTILCFLSDFSLLSMVLLVHVDDLDVVVLLYVSLKGIEDLVNFGSVYWLLLLEKLLRL